MLVCCPGVDSRFVGQVRALPRGLPFVRPRRGEQRHQGAEAAEIVVPCVRRARPSDVGVARGRQRQQGAPAVTPRVTTRHDTTRHDTTRHGTARHGTARQDRTG